MNIKIEKQIKEKFEIEVTFPLFTVDVIHTFMFKSEHECVAVMSHSDARSIEKHSKGCFPTSWMAFEPCSRESFLEKYNQAKKDLDEYILL